MLVLTMFDDDDSVFAAMRAGARGYVVKGAEQDEIARAVHAVAAGEAIFSPGVAQRVLRYFAGAAGRPPTRSPSSPPASGRSWTCWPATCGNAAIAARLGLSPKTVANHLSSIFDEAVRRRPGRSRSCARGRPGSIGSVTRDDDRPARPRPWVAARPARRTRRR